MDANLVQLKPEQILTGYYRNARTTTGWDKRSMEELKASIAERGLLYPLLVAKVTTKEGEEAYAVLGGHRRLEAIRQLTKEKKANGLSEAIPVHIATVADATEAQLTALEDAIQREDLSTYEIACELMTLKTEGGLSQKDLAKRLHRSEGWVSKALKSYETASESLRKAWEKDEIPFETIQNLAKLEPEEQDSAVKEQLSLRTEGARAQKAEARKKAANKVEKKARKSADRPGVQYIQSIYGLVEAAPENNRYLKGLRDGLGYALGTTAIGDFADDYGEYCHKVSQAKSPAKKAAKK